MPFGPPRSFLAAFLFALPALAAPPGVLDRVPGSTPAVVVIRDMAGAARAMKPLTDLNKNDTNEAADTIKMLLANPGIKQNGSLALIFPTVPPVADPDAMDDEEGAEPAAEPDMLVLVEVTDYAKFMEGLGGKAEEGVGRLNIDGNDVFVRKAEGFAVMGPSRDLVTGFNAAAGQMKTHEARLGKVGNHIADSADVLMVLDMPAFKAHILSDGELPMDGMDMPGGMGEGLEALNASMKGIKEAVARDGQAAVIGLNASGGGLTFDSAAIFRENSECAEIFSTSGSSGDLMKSLPDQPFYFAGGVDLTSPAMRHLAQHMGMLRKEAGDDQAPSAMDGLMASLEKSDGMGFVVGSNKAGPMAGVFVNTAVFIKTKDAAGLLSDLRANAGDGTERTVGTTKVKVDYKKDVAEAAGAKFDAWTTTVTLDQNDPNSFMAGMMMQTMFGQPKGFSQMAAATENGLVMTMSQNTPLMSSAIQAAQGGKGLHQGESVAGIRSKLHESRGLELYIGVGTIMQDVGGMLAGYLGEEIDVPANLPPIGMSASMEHGAFATRIFMPGEVMAAIADVMQKLEEAEGDMVEEPMDEDM